MTTIDNTQTTETQQQQQPTPSSELVKKAKEQAEKEPVATAALIIGILNLFS